MTAGRDFDRQLGAWLDERATSSAPDGLLERSLARVGVTRQRPGWLVRDRWRSPRAMRRPATAPARAGRLFAIAVAIVVVATGASLFLGLLRGTIAGPSSPPSIAPAPSSSGATASAIPPETPTPTAAVRPGALIAYTRTVDRPLMTPENPGGAQCYTYDSTCPVSRAWIIGSDGSGAHELFPDGGSGQHVLGWSPDGTRLLYSDDGLYLADPSGSEPELLDTGCVAPCAVDFDAAFSSDGTHLVFVRSTTDAAGYVGPTAITTMDLANGRVTELSSTAPDGGSLPGWSPDGTQIAFFRYGDKDMGISGPIPAKKTAVFVVDADGQNLHQVSPATLAAQFPGWSPDGARIVFASPEADRQDIYTVRPDGTDLRQLTTGGASYGATWTPDGRILFVRGVSAAGTDGAPSFWTMDADGSNAAQFIPGTVTGAAPGDFDWWRGPVWQPIGGPSIVPPPWNPSTSTSVGPPPPTPPATPAPALSPGFSWTGSMDSGGETATVLPDGRILVTISCSAAAELYDPTTGTFSPTGSLTATRGGETATLLRDGRVLIVGGGSCGDAEHDGIWASAELYDPRTGTFHATGSMGTPRARHTATLLADGRVLITGGITGQSPVASVSVVFASYHDPTTAMTAESNTLSSAEVYDPVTGTFSRTGSMRDFRDRHTATLLGDGRVLVVGGGGEGYAARTSAELYNPTTGTFSRTGSMKSGRWMHTATLLGDGRVLITGGRSPNDTDYVTAELYDPGTGRFTLTGSMHAARQEQTATLLADGRVFIAGGYLQDAVHWDVLSSTELYDPATGKFSRVGSMGEARSGQTATLLSDGRVLIVGGSGIGYPVGAGPTSAVLYQP
jgi:Tol biopolymer transport system component